MDYLKPIRRKLNPERNINIFFKLFFIYSRKILIKGYRKELTEDDVYEVLPSYKSKKLGDVLEIEWKKLVNSKKPSLIRLIWRSFGKEYLVFIFSSIIIIIAGAVQPKILKKFISYFTSEDVSKNYACLYGFTLLLILLINSLYYQNYLLRIHTFILKIRVGFTSLVYRQILKMDTLQLDSVSVGKILTLVTKDVNEFESIFVLTNIVRDIFGCILVCYMLYTEIGWLFLILVFIILLIVLPDAYLAIWIRNMKIKTLKKTEERYQQTKEVLSSIKLIKFYLWGEKYQDKICELRRKEVGFIKKIYIWLWVKYVFADFILDISWYIVLISCIYFGLQLNAETLFLIMNSINVLSRSVKLNLPVVFHKLAAIIAVFKRLEQFLKSVPDSKINHKDVKLPPKITLANLVVYTDKTLLEGLNFESTPGIIIICGPIGSGKSTLLKVITKEHCLIEGNLTVSGRLSYASQEPWLFPSTIKQNILFGAKYDEKRYCKVLKVCALIYDLERLKEGDKTLVKDKGTNLSKGQQVRINLARAVYQNCDIYLLDDCLSNLDVIVADYIFKECIQKFLHDKTVIMVSQNERHITAANTVIKLGGQKTEVIVQQPTTLTETEEHDVEKRVETDFQDSDFDETTKLIPNQTNEILYKEHKKTGQVEFKAYKSYIFSGGLILFSLVLFLLIPVQFLRFNIRKLETKWVNSEQIIFNNLTTSLKYEEAVQVRTKMIYILPMFVIAVTLLNQMRNTLFWTFAAKASINLHKLLFTKITNATMQFFDTYLIGTILNRFSEDLLYIDETVSFTILIFINIMMVGFGSIILIGTVNFIFLIPCLLIIIVLIFTRSFYLKSGRALKRLEFASRSPLCGVINATMDGLSTIRVSKQQNILKEEFDTRLDLYTSCSYVYLTTTETFYFFVYMCGVCLVAFVVVFLLFTGKSNSVGNVGLVLIQTMGFSTTSYFLLRCWTNMENDMTTVERTLEYTKQKQEQKEGVLVKNWPQYGQINCQKVCFSYRNDDNLILNNLDFCIKSKEKVAVVGRTGSGKTSLLYTLLRLYKYEGKITIDDVDITTLPLHFFRSKISVIPQDPVLFTGSLRDNIDPTGKYTDEEIWTTIRTVKLSAVFDGLEEKISGVDSNLSLGQKQLICLCRALIRKSKIVILDELTANVDEDTETMVHEIIKEYFTESTVIMITHKLRYVLDYDKILVLDKGRALEFGSPSSLLENKNGEFYKMYKNV